MNWAAEKEKCSTSYDHFECLGVDFSAKMASVVLKKYPDLEFICADAHDVNIDEKFDIIILLDILNDCEDVQNLLMNISKKLSQQNEDYNKLF